VKILKIGDKTYRVIEKDNPYYTRTQIVGILRALGKGLATVKARTYFPPKEAGEKQPVDLKGYVPMKDLGGLLYYIADMLEE
jgi:hypothetical protein